MTLLTSSEDLCRRFHVVDGDAAVEADRKILRPFGSHKVHEFQWRNIQKVQIVVKDSNEISKESPLGLELALCSSSRLEQVSNRIDIEVFPKLQLQRWF